MGYVMWEIDELSSINKLKSLIQKRFGKGLEISRLTDLNSVKPDSDFFFKKTDMIIPIFHDETYLGTAIVKKADDVDEEQWFTLSSLVKMTLTPALYSQYLSLQENNLQIAEEETESEIESIFPSALKAEVEGSSKIISQVIHLNGINEIVLKVAHQIHELEKRWGFVPLKDLNIKLEEINDLKKLGAMTVFIKDITELTLHQQNIIAQYLAEVSGSEFPLVIIGSSLNLEEIANHPSITTDLLLGLDKFTFEVNKAPMNYAKLKEVAEMLFYIHE